MAEMKIALSIEGGGGRLHRHRSEHTEKAGGMG